MRPASVRRLLAVATAALVLASLPGPAAAYHPSGWHWRRGSNPFELRLVDSVTAAWQGRVEKAAAEWSDRSGRIDVTLENGSTKAATRRKCPAPDGAARICNADYGDKPWAAITRLVIKGNHILRVKIKLNDRGATAHRALACHEIGHALGLNHRRQAETSSCLTPVVTGSQKHPDRHDIRQLAAIYKHLDGSGTQATDLFSAAEAEHEHPDGEHVRIVRRGDLTIVHIRTLRTPAPRLPR